MSNSSGRKWIFPLILLFLLSVLIWAAVIRTIQVNKQKEIQKKTFSYDQGKPNPIFENPDLLKVINKTEENGIPFFPEIVEQIPQIHWQLRYFQPYVRSITEKDGAVFLETEILDMNSQPKKVLVFVGGQLNGKNYPFIAKRENDRVFKLQNRENLEQSIKKDQRISIQYLQTADNYETALKNEICQVYKDPACQVGEIVSQNQEAYLNFYQTGELPDNLYLLGILVDDKLNEN